MSNRELFAIKYGEGDMGENQMFYGGDASLRRQISFTLYLFKCDGKNILIDSGCENMTGFNERHFISPREALALVGLTPADITDLIITHAHYDHIASAKIYENAEIYIQEDEYEKGKDYLCENAKLYTFSEEIFVNSSTRVKKIGSHTKGSSVVFIENLGKKYLICADEVYNGESITLGKPCGCAADLEKNLAFIKEYKDGYTHLYSHGDFLSGRCGVIKIF